MSPSSNREKSPIKFVVGATLTLLLSTAFYLWLLHKVFKVSTGFLTAVAVQLAVVEVIVIVKSYRLWLIRNNVQHHTRPQLPIRTVLMLMAAVGVPCWAAAYLLFAGARRSGTILALVAGIIAIHSASELEDIVSAQGGAVPALLARAAALRVPRALLVLAVLLPFVVASVFVFQGETGMAAASLVAAGTTALWAVLRTTLASGH